MSTQTGRILLAFQEILTVIVRLRAGRQQVSNSEHFRQQIRAALTAAHSDAVRQGYTPAEASIATQAVVAFLDESILNLGNQMHDWVRQPLGPEYFQQHVAGEVYFRNIRDLLTGEDSAKTANLLDVYQVCLLLGYRGRFGPGRDGDVRTIVDRIAEKVQRINGAIPLLQPKWRLEGESVPLQADPWGLRLKWIAAGAAGLFVILFLLYWLLLGNGVRAVVVARETIATVWGSVAC